MFSYPPFVTEEAAKYARRILWGQPRDVLELPDTPENPGDAHMHMLNPTQLIVYYLTCLHLACKMHSTVPYSNTLSGSISFACGWDLTKAEVVELEIEVLDALGWRLLQL